MSDSPYAEGWPRYVGGGYLCEFEALQVVPLSDAERMRKQIVADHRIKASIADNPCACECCSYNPERDK